MIQKRTNKPQRKVVLPPAPKASGPPPNSPPPTAEFPIVGIGASAGGLAAFEAFFSAMPADTDPGMAFILVQHLAPDHKSILTELVKRYTPMQVFAAKERMIVQPNCAYIIPPNRDMALEKGALRLSKPTAPRGQRLPIDFFFASLAREQNKRAIAIILSGTGSDGSLGVRAIKAEGGMVLVQSPGSTEFDGMPRAAIATGMVDYVMPPAEMPAQLLAHAGQTFGMKARPHSPSEDDTTRALSTIHTLLRAHTGHDFSHYKHNTIIRRIKRRMAVHALTSLDDYVHLAQQDPAEVKALFSDLLIGVTAFFRDPEVFEAFQEQAIPRLFAGKSPESAIRVWVPGCSTGEEAYSIAILIQEHLEKLKQNFKVQVFATDIDSRAIEQARAGSFPPSIAADVSPERLARFFTVEPGSTAYRVHRSIRELLIFSEQDIIKDPPFSKLDLICCRNLLIYMDGDLQKKLIPLFHYALNPSGLLFLGTSESVGDFVDLFATLDRKAKLYQRNDDVHGKHELPLERFVPLTERRTPHHVPEKDSTCTMIPLPELIERTLLEEWDPAAALVNNHGDILYLHGRTGFYLEPTPGEAGVNNILKMAREGLQRDLTVALRKAVERSEPIRHRGLRVKTNGHFTTVDLTVRPVAAVPGQPSKAALFLVILKESPPAVFDKPVAAEPNKTSGKGDKDADACVVALERELRAQEEYLRSTKEELETSNEELKSSNEEMQSMNEELQSTNEELETSKEELQSVNEELATVNAELQTKVADLSRVNNDMSNLLAGTGMGTIFVDQQQRIQRFTPIVGRVINLIPTDVGRPVGHIVSNLAGYDRLVEDVQEVLDTLIPKEVEVQTKSGTWYLLGIRPYRTLENVIEGAVITFVDTTEMKKAQLSLRDSEALRRLEAVLRDTRDAIIVHDIEGRILLWNPVAERFYGWSEAEALRLNIRDTIPENEREDALEGIKRLSQSEILKPFEMQRLTKNCGAVNVWVTATALVNEPQGVYAIATTERRKE